MSGFLKEKQFVKHFPNKDDTCLLCVGYDDFKYVKPMKYFWVQNKYSLHFVLSGKGIFQIGGKTYRIKKGQMFLTPDNVKMRYFPEEDEPWEYMWFSMKSNIGKEYAKILGFSVENPVIECNKFSEITIAIKNMFDALLEDRGGYFTALSAFYNILEMCVQKNVTGIKAIKNHIDQTFSTPDFSIDRLCRDMGISHAQLLRQFKKEYGITVIKYVIKKRIELACTFLKTTDLSVKSVAYSCGFMDEVHFMKTFKKETGISAGNFKKS